MGTTSGGLRYPEPTEPVSQGAVNIRNLAEDVTGKYQAAPGVATTFYPDMVAVPVGTVIKMAAGKVNLTTDSQGQAVLTFPGNWTTIVSVVVTPAVSPSLPLDYVFNVGPRAAAASCYVYRSESWREVCRQYRGLLCRVRLLGGLRHGVLGNS